MLKDYYTQDYDFGHFFAPEEGTLSPAEEKWLEVYRETYDSQLAHIIVGASFKHQPKSMPFWREYRAIKDYAKANKEQKERRIVTETSDIAFADIRQIFDEEGQLRRITDLPREVAAAISSIEVIANGDSSAVLKYRFHPKMAALESLAKQLNLYKENNKLEAEVKTEEVGEGSSDKDLARRLAFILKRGINADKNSQE